jgi:hypothetical protein
MKGAFPWFVRWIRRAGTRDFYALDALVSKVQKEFSSPYTILIYVYPSPSNLGRQSGRAACLSECVSPVPTARQLR